MKNVFLKAVSVMAVSFSTNVAAFGLSAVDTSFLNNMDNQDVQEIEDIPTTLGINQIAFKFGGWSHHSDAIVQNYDFNESHNGFGIELNWELSDNGNHLMTGGVWYMEDSHYEDQYNFGLGYTYRMKTDWIPFIHAVDANIIVTYNDRSKLIISRETREAVRTEDWSFVVPLPSLTVHVTENLHADFVYIPEMDDGMLPETFFVRGGVAFDMEDVVSLFD